jgi:hypothetical protein
MKKTLMLVALFGALAFAADDQKPKTNAPAGVPAGAVKSGAFAWRYTDAQGKKWIYRQTPFGLVKVEDTGEDKSQDAPADAKNPTTVTDLGDSVKFDRDTPFGHQTWTKKKTDLNADEASQAKQSQSSVKPCAPGDKQRAGTVVDGYKKVVGKTPFGEVCRWEPVN